MIKKLILFLFILFTAINLIAQKRNSSCNFKKLSRLINEVKANDTKSELDKLFGVEGQLVSELGQPDSIAKIYNYQFCDSNIKNTYTASFRKNKLVYILKSFKNGKCFGSGASQEFNFKKNSSYKEIKEIFEIDGDLKMISWDLNNFNETEIVYEWMCCDNVTYYSVVFENGKFKSAKRFPIKQDYSRPSSGKK